MEKCTLFWETCKCSECRKDAEDFRRLEELEKEKWLDDNEQKEYEKIRDRLQDEGYTLW